MPPEKAEPSSWKPAITAMAPSAPMPCSTSAPARKSSSASPPIRAPRTANNQDLALAPIGSSITGASAIVVEGTRLYDLTGSANATITSAIQSQIRNDATSFLGSAGTTTATYSAILSRLTSLQPALPLILTPGAEIINRSGDLTLGSASSTSSADWDLSSFRFGPKSAAGTLTLRASQNITLFNALSDGFSGGPSLWLAPLMANNPLLPANSQSWSYRIAAGADLSSATFRAVTPLASLAQDKGTLQLGKNTGAATATGGANALTSSVITNAFQVIRTGSGNIDIHTGRSLQLLNPFTSIYTAGTQVSSPTTVKSANDFIVPILDRNVNQGNLGAAQQTYSAQYSMAGGSITLSAAADIERKTRNNSGLIDDSSRQMPNNWLHRRGLVDATGEFGKLVIGSGFTATSDPAASTTWWVNFSNFFQGVGALGGGNVTLAAGGNVSNVDAVIPTNARAARGTPSPDSLVELGGGNLLVTSGNDISGGIYYVERGHGILSAGASISTNATRSPSFGLTANLNNPAAARLDPLTWLPTTLFVGKSSFDLTAAGNLLLGPVSNPFLLPQGVTNRFWYKTHFSTVSPESKVTALSLGGDVSYRNAVTLAGQNQAQPMLRAWHETQLLFTGSASSTSWLQPWLRLAETSLVPFSPLWSLSASNLSLTSFSADVNLTGNLTTFPSPTGQLEIIAARSINALQPTGISNLLIPGKATQSWFSSTINLSDANPASIPSFRNPLTAATQSANGAVITNSTNPGFMDGLAALFNESGSVTGTNAVQQTRQARHTPGGLHNADSQPLRIHALGGNLSGLTLFSAKQARISASSDISDVSLYIQNNNPTDSTVVTAGRDIIAFNSSSPLRVTATSGTNRLSFGQSSLAGDIQLAGPGTLQVLAGRNLDLGLGSNNPDGTGTGISTIGNLRNPFLPAQGADAVIAAGIRPANDLASSDLALDSFIRDFVLTPDGLRIVREIHPGMDFASLPENQQALVAIEVFYRILRNSGRDFNDTDSPSYQSYDKGLAAIKSLFGPLSAWNGGVLARGRDIRTRNGGNISILAPGGGLTLANTTIGNPLAPPGIITEAGGLVSIFTRDSVDIGIGRIFTLRGGDVMIWSSQGDIAAGTSSRTVQSAPPTRVIIDPQSAAVQTDLAGLATGGGIGVLATIQGVNPGDVDLIAPSGIIDAGDAGIRVSGNINLAAVQVVNSGNIAAGGTSSGGTVSVAAPSVAAITTASNTAATSSSTNTATPENTQERQRETDAVEPSIITVEVIGYGGGSAAEEDEETDGPVPAAVP
jgi:filamentous hemagglutinin